MFAGSAASRENGGRGAAKMRNGASDINTPAAGFEYRRGAPQFTFDKFAA